MQQHNDSTMQQQQGQGQGQRQGQQEHEKQILTVKALEEAVALLLQNNFDADSQVCLVTIMKIIDNVLHKPGDDKVRQLRLNNATVWNKVGKRPGGIELLQACGFERTIAPPPLLSSVTSNIASSNNPPGGQQQQQQDLLTLPPHREDTQLLITARRLLHTRAVQDLSMDPNQLPPFREPPPPLQHNNTTTATTSGGFSIYEGHRYDAKSAAVGQNLGPSGNYKSKTDTELQLLRQKQEKLEQQMHQTPVPRHWQAFAPASSSTATTTSTLIVGGTSVSGSTGGSTTGGDSGLLAARMQKQSAERRQREEGGFTTAAMREVERLKKQKVYSHVTLTIQFPSGHFLRGQFLPKDKIHQVVQALCRDCLLPSLSLSSSNGFLDLYVTPPRKLLSLQSSLQQEGLVPAAKVFVSWKNGCTPQGPFLQPHLFQPEEGNKSVAFPTAQGVATEATAAGATSAGAQKKPAAKKKTSKSERQEEMLKRMMGGGL